MGPRLRQTIAWLAVISSCAFLPLAVIPAEAGQQAKQAGLPVGTVLPQVTGEDLTGAKITLPDAAKGRVTLIAFGFSYDSRTPVEAWSEHVKKAFGSAPDFSWYQVPMVGGLGRLAKPFIMGGMRKQTPTPRNTVVVFGGVGPWKERFVVKNDALAYLVLLDRAGVVKWFHSGVFDAATANTLDQQVQGLLAATATP